MSQHRCDFLRYRLDGYGARLHPGSRKDAIPVYSDHPEVWLQCAGVPRVHPRHQRQAAFRWESYFAGMWEGQGILQEGVQLVWVMCQGGGWGRAAFYSQLAGGRSFLHSPMSPETFQEEAVADIDWRARGLGLRGRPQRIVGATPLFARPSAILLSLLAAHVL